MGGRRIILSRTEYVEKLLSPSIKNQYMVRFPYTQGLDELGIMGRGLLANHNLRSWSYNRHFFTQAILAPKFTKKAIDWTNELFNELEIYWNKLYLKDVQNKLNCSAWLHRYANDMIIALTTGERSYTMASYFNIQSDEKSEHPQALVDDSENFVQAFRKQILGGPLFIFIPPFFRHYVPFFKSRSDALLRNIEFIYQRLESIIKRRRQEIEISSLDKPLSQDMLTSLITANTSRDINHVETVEGEVMNLPMTDLEIRSILFETFLGGTEKISNLLTFIIYYIARNPDVKKKMLEEIDNYDIDLVDKDSPLKTVSSALITCPELLVKPTPINETISLSNSPSITTDSATTANTSINKSSKVIIGTISGIVGVTILLVIGIIRYKWYQKRKHGDKIMRISGNF
ncbi:13447_t:CDS:2 [Funneliformis caledonium]|uniref:13447_t:CDS:1 n=1 Tax=Funneliformis caledonium TaxID=1117310 RepID=A0A9N8YPG7_9GLOM|nr:13447_t:CDS:2 [Funneliformis caledonium]